MQMLSDVNDRVLTFVIWWLLHDDVFSFQMLKMLVLMFSPGRSCHHSFLLQRPVCLMMKMLCEYFLIYVDDCMFYSLRCSRCMMTTTIISISLCQSLDLYLLFIPISEITPHVCSLSEWLTLSVLLSWWGFDGDLFLSLPCDHFRTLCPRWW